MTIGKRLRFEIFKRDGFRCVYCGASPMSSVLRVDHVQPVADGGGDEPENLVTACHDCNAGKSDVSLDHTMSRTPTTDEVIQQAADLDSFRLACGQLNDARVRLDDWLVMSWQDATGEDGIEQHMLTRLRNVLQQHGPEVLADALAAIRGRRMSSTRLGQYFNGVVRTIVQRREEARRS